MIGKVRLMGRKEVKVCGLVERWEWDGGVVENGVITITMAICVSASMNINFLFSFISYLNALKYCQLI